MNYIKKIKTKKIKKIIVIIITFTIFFFINNKCKNSNINFSIKESFKKIEKNIQNKNLNSALNEIKYFKKNFLINKYLQKCNIYTSYIKYKKKELNSSLQTLKNIKKIKQKKYEINYIYYIHDIINFKLNKNKIYKIFNINENKRDLSQYKKSIKKLNLINKKFKNQKYEKDINIKIIKLSKKIIKKEIYISKFYLKNKSYYSTINRITNIINQYNNIALNNNKMIYIMKLYKKLKMNDIVQYTKKVMKQNK